VFFFIHSFPSTPPFSSVSLSLSLSLCLSVCLSVSFQVVVGMRISAFRMVVVVM
jgi:hypothetical protein